MLRHTGSGFGLKSYEDSEVLVWNKVNVSVE